MRDTISRIEQNPGFIVSIIVLLFMLIAALAYLPATSSGLATFTTIFLGIFIEAAPFLILGTLASGVVEVYVDQDAIHKIMPKSPILGALAGSVLGLFFPVCECGVVPLVRRLMRKGLPVPAGIAFLLAAPVINPIVILSTASAFGFGKILLLRVGFTLVIAIVTGLVFTAASSPWEVLRPTLWSTSEEDENDDHHHDSESVVEKTSHLQKIKQIFQITLDEFFEIGRFLILGSLFAAGMQTFIPQNILLNFGSGPVVSVLVMMGTAILLSICSTVDSFIALGFTGIFTTGSILGFLIYGPMVDIKSVLLFLRILRPRAVFYVVTIPFLLVLLIGISMNYLLY